MTDLSDINTYINQLYEQETRLTKEKFTHTTQLEDFSPVVDDDVARYLKLLIRMIRPGKILEVGTCIGYSTTSMAQVVKEYGGRITTIEYDDKIAKQAALNFDYAGVSDAIELKIGDAMQILPSLNDKEFDFIFLDVDKRLYPVLFNDCLRILKSGGLLVAEDTLFPVLELDAKWHDLIEPIEQFNQQVIHCPELESTLLPIGDGVIVARKA
ncbi:O-methyltransferase [Paenibacillus puldeungensis]|uniref:O-methyltransferase n=1 Tax=Paenibacillus puldeungensis TaxID=696536 RepID=A0ABW3RZZ7_9BACL